MNPPSWQYDRTELIADAVIHVAGVCFAVAGAVALIAFKSWGAEPGIAIAMIVYAMSLVATLSMSAVYNMWPVTPVKWRLRRYDHAAIFLLIAGTYTPFLLAAGSAGLLIFVWSAAIAGICLKILFAGQFDRLAILFYLGLGWSGAGLFSTMFSSFASAALLLLAGGIIYSVGVIFHLWHRLRFQNAIWHAFVLAGATIHYSAVATVF